MVEHGTENAGVDSSSLSLGTFVCPLAAPFNRPDCPRSCPLIPEHLLVPASASGNGLARTFPGIAVSVRRPGAGPLTGSGMARQRYGAVFVLHGFGRHTLASGFSVLYCQGRYNRRPGT